MLESRHGGGNCLVAAGVVLRRPVTNAKVLGPLL
jgi:hypothetical protein